MTSAAMKALARQRHNARFAIINIGRKAIGLQDEAAYRAMLHKVTGKRSLKEMDLHELDRVIDYMVEQGFKPSAQRKAPPKRAGTRPMDDSPQSRKLRALWIAGYHLGVIRDPKEDALAKFARRMTRKDALQWLDGEEANTVIEALKDMLAREAGVEWLVGERREQLRQDDQILAAEDRYWIIQAQWQFLVKAGEIRTPNLRAEAYGGYRHYPWRFVWYDDEHWTRLMEELGRMVRRVKANARERAEASS